MIHPDTVNSMSTANANREEWLLTARDRIKELLFDPREMHLPPVIRVSVGLCGGKAIGLCAHPDCSEDGSIHIFIDPKIKESIQVLSTLVHEMVHASVGNECKHKGPFVKAIRELGLAGKPTATYAEAGTELYATLEAISVELGEYPHAVLVRKPKETKPCPWIAYISQSMGEDYTVRANKNVVAEYGPPLDPHGEPMIPKNPEDRLPDSDDESGADNE